MLQNERTAHALMRETTFGKIEGKREGQALSWLGIPYAQPPVGGLRWRAPQAPTAWAGIREAKSYGSDSVQRSPDGRVIGSEDCLYLNVFRPDTDENALPVMLFIHGGNNQTDSGRIMDGALLAAETNAVIVTFNLRLNALGWLNIPAIKTGNPLEDSGNFGLLDIAKALDWVRENCAVFGGDAARLTVCGYSSGARDLLCMLISPLFRGKFAQAITFSGSFTTTEPSVGAEISTRAIARLAVEDARAESVEAAVEWLNHAGQDAREWLYGLAAERFGPLMAGAAIRMSVFPHLFTDGAVIPKEGFDAVKSGAYWKVPLLLNSGGREFAFQANGDPLFQGADYSDPQVQREYRFVTTYGGALFGYANAEQSAKAFTATPDHPPVYASRFCWGMNPAVTGGVGAMRMGGTHGLDLYLMMGVEREAFRITDEVFTPENKPGRAALAKLQRAYLGNFLRTGDPNGAGLPRWEEWDNAQGGAKLLILDADKTTPSVKMSAECVAEEAVFAAVRADKTLCADRRAYLIEHVLGRRFFSKKLDEEF